MSAKYWQKGEAIDYTAAAKIAAGASLVQLYSGFIYRGPELIRECVDAISAI